MSRLAPEGAVWVCGACGKTHTDRYGIEGKGARGWDASCALNAILVHDKQYEYDGVPTWISFDRPLPFDPRPL